EPEEIAWKLCPTRVEDERSAHSKGCAEETGFEDHVVARRSLAGFRRIGGRWAIGRPVVLRENERREIDLTCQLEEPLERRGPWIERRRPGLHVGYVLETTRQPLQQLLLLSRGAQENARLVHPFLSGTNWSRRLRFGNFGHRPGHPFRLFLERQGSQGHK